MANILYGVNGEGAGHSTRAKEVIAHLQQRGHAVHVVSFDRGLANLRKDFGRDKGLPCLTSAAEAAFSPRPKCRPEGLLHPNPLQCGDLLHLYPTAM
jgi:hypothetical protein